MKIPAPLALRLQITTQSAAWSRAQPQQLQWLTHSEQARLGAIRLPARRFEFLACRHALRHVLATSGGFAAEQWRLDAFEGQAPRLNAQYHGDCAAAATYLSLSHSGQFLACVASGKPVGIDLEVKDIRSVTKDVFALAAIACTDQEARQLHAIGCPSSRYRKFLQFWCLKEAYFKFLGTGIDFSRLRRIDCRDTVPRDMRPLAKARLWAGKTSHGHDVVLAACVPNDGAQPDHVEVEADIEWHGESDWVLAEAR